MSWKWQKLVTSLETEPSAVFSNYFEIKKDKYFFKIAKRTFLLIKLILLQSQHFGFQKNRLYKSKLFLYPQIAIDLREHIFFYC